MGVSGGTDLYPRLMTIKSSPFSGGVSGSFTDDVDQLTMGRLFKYFSSSSVIKILEMTSHWKFYFNLKEGELIVSFVHSCSSS